MSKTEALKDEVSKLYSEGRNILVAEIKNQREQAKGVAAPTKASVGSKKTGTKKSKTPETAAPQKEINVPIEYQKWYSKALSVIKQLLPERYDEFQEQYKNSKRKEIDYLTYTISDYLIGLRVTRGYMKEEVVNPLSAFIRVVAMGQIAATCYTA